MTYNIYGKNENEQVLITTITSDTKEYADKIVDMLFDYQEWTDYGIFFETIWVEEKGEE